MKTVSNEREESREGAYEDAALLLRKVESNMPGQHAPPKRILLTINRNIMTNRRITMIQSIIKRRNTRPFRVITPITIRLTNRTRPNRRLNTQKQRTIPNQLTNRFIRNTKHINRRRRFGAFNRNQRNQRYRTSLNRSANSSRLLLTNNLSYLSRIFIIPNISLTEPNGMEHVQRRHLRLKRRQAIKTNFGANNRSNQRFRMLNRINRNRRIILRAIKISITRRQRRTYLIVRRRGNNVVLIRALMEDDRYDDPHILSVPDRHQH